MLYLSASIVGPQSQHPNDLLLQHEEIEAFKNQYSLCTPVENGQIHVIRALIEQDVNDVDDMNTVELEALLSSNPHIFLTSGLVRRDCMNIAQTLR